MSKVIFNYPHLENAQKIYNTIVKNYEKFDRGGPDADRAKNFKAVQYVLNTDENMYDVDFRLWIVKMEDDYEVKSLYTYDMRIHTYVDLNPSEGIEQMFDFYSPLDVLALLEDFAERAHEFKTFYQIKEA